MFEMYSSNRIAGSRRFAFPETGVASVVAEHPNGRRIEIGIIGCEGMTGSAVVLGSDRTPHTTYIQVAVAFPKLNIGG